MGHTLAKLFQDHILKYPHKCFRLSREPGNGIFDTVKKIGVIHGVWQQCYIWNYISAQFFYIPIAINDLSVKVET